MLRNRDPLVYFLLTLTGLCFAQCLAGIYSFVASPALSDATVNVQPGFRLAAIFLFLFGGLCVLWLAKSNAPRLLGIVLLLLGAAYSYQFSKSFTNPVARILFLSPTEAFLPFILWLFAFIFPDNKTLRLGAIIALLCVFSISFGLFIINVLFLLGIFPANHALSSLDHLTQVGKKATLYDSIVYLLAIFSLVIGCIRYLLNKSLKTKANRVFFYGLSISLLLPSLYIVGTVFLPDQASRYDTALKIIALALIVAILTGPFITAYSIIVDGVMPIRVILRKPVQYLVAKSTLTLYASIPFILIGIYFYQLRTQTIADIVGQLEFGLLAAFCILGVVVFRKRETISKSIDKRFFRDKIDHQLLLFELNNSIRNSVGEDDLYDRILKIIQDAVHPKVCFLFLLDKSSGQYRNATQREDTLDLRRPLIDHITKSRSPIEIKEDQAAIAAEDWQWLQGKAIDLILPLTSSNGELMAFCGLGEKNSELKYTSDELKLLQSLIGPMVLAMENLSFRTSSPPATLTHFSRPKFGGGLCYYCSQCGSVTGDKTKSCCGGKLIPSQLPFAIHSRFHLEKFLGAGKSGEVYLAYDIDLMRRVALKTLHATSADEAHLLRQESVAAAATNHKNIATIYDTLVWQQTPILVFEYLPMGTLSRQIRKGPLAINEVIKLGTTLSDALHHLHSRDILHRDIKPANIAYTIDMQPKIMDFGLARVSRKHKTEKKNLDIHKLSIEETRTTLNNHQWIGTPLYWSPETIQGQTPGPWTDTWALCTVLYETLTGAHPFLKETWPESMQLITKGEITPPNAVRQDCPVALSEIIVQGLQKSRADRLSAAEDLHAGFQGLIRLNVETVTL